MRRAFFDFSFLIFLCLLSSPCKKTPWHDKKKQRHAWLHSSNTTTRKL